MAAGSSIRALAPDFPAGVAALVGDHPEVARAREVALDAARSRSAVLVVGESGTGKRLFGRVLHAQTARPGPIVTWNGGSARELHDAIAAASDGVVHIEDLAEVRPETQAYLLRVLEDGAPAQIVVGVTEDPRQPAGQGQLRPELVQRLSRCTVRLPPLHDRREDIPALVDHFLESFCSRRCGCLQGVGEDALEALGAHDWPGNVRELRAAIEQAVMTGRSPWITVRDLPPPIGRPGEAIDEDHELPTLAESEARLIRLTLHRFNGNKVRAARSLGISRHKLYERLRKLGIAS